MFTSVDSLSSPEFQVCCEYRFSFLCGGGHLRGLSCPESVDEEKLVKGAKNMRW